MRDRRVYAHVLTGRSAAEIATAYRLSIPEVLAIVARHDDPNLVSVAENLLASHRRHGLPLPWARPRRSRSAPPPAPPRTASRAQAPRVLDDDILSAIRRAVQASPSGVALSQDEYILWRAQSDPSAPAVRTIRRRLGWGAAKQAALRGLAPESGDDDALAAAGIPPTEAAASGF